MTFLPVVERELRVASRRKSTFHLRVWTAVAGITMLLFAFATTNLADSAAIGSRLFNWLTAVTFIYTSLAGIFLTADSLISEKRSGTLGLLFLTDLRSYDIVLGKMAASSLPAFYGLLAVFPVLGLPLLLGGVTGAEFFRVALVLTLSLVFSLSVGLMASAVCSEIRKGILVTFAIAAVFGGVIPSLFELFRRGGPRVFDLLVLPVPGAALFRAFDSAYLLRKTEFMWASAGTLVLTVAFLILAFRHVQRSMCQSEERPEKRSQLVQRVRRMFAPVRKQRSPVAETNPFLWLGCADGSSGHYAKLVAWLVLPVGLWFLITAIFGFKQITAKTSNPVWAITIFCCMALAWASHIVIKYLITFEACHRLGERRASGALELVLVTPATDREILDGHRRALFKQFATPLVWITILNIAISMLITTAYTKLDIGKSDTPMFLTIFLGGAVALWLDFWAISWIGPWRALTAANQNRAVAVTLFWIFGAPWLGLVVIIFLLSTGATRIREPELISVWLFCALVIDAVAGFSARDKLSSGIRALVRPR